MTACLGQGANVWAGCFFYCGLGQTEYARDLDPGLQWVGQGCRFEF
uniref:Uncharacterized protein n=1 Tax=Arundo donax TaxID=35708 RepID=A0A0A9CGC3_ARUDO